MRSLGRGWLLVGGLVVAAAGTACVPSEHPLSDATTSTVDEKLLGTWELDGDVFLVRRAGAANTLEQVYLEHGKEAGEPSAVYTTVIGGQRFLSAEAIDKETGRKTYDIARYELVGEDTVKVRCLDVEAIARAIQAKELAGTAVQSKDEEKRLSSAEHGLIAVGPLLEGLFGSDTSDESPAAKPVPPEETWHVTLTDSPEQIARYLETHSAECFPARDAEDMLVFKRKR